MRSDPRARFALVVGLGVWILSTGAWASDYRTVKGSQVEFLAKITGGSFKGKSDTIQGTVEVKDPDQTIKKGEIRVDAATLETGMSLRDGHMRDKYLEVKKYPELRFTIPAQAFALKADAKGEIQGMMSVKGIAKKVQVPLKVSEKGKDRLRVEAKFPLNIVEFEIPQPTFAVVKMDPVVEVSIDLVLEKAP